MASEATVFVVDDDAAVRKSLTMLMKSVGLPCETFESADHFLEAFDPERPGCLVLDVRMPGMSGIELQQQLLGRHASIPIIFITGHGDVPMAVETMKAGAIDFIQKPFRDQDLIDRIQQALEDDARIRAEVADRDVLRTRMDLLTPRETEVMDLVVQGLPNKAIAMELDLSERTVEIHRSRVMGKMEAESLPHLVKQVLEVRRSG